MIIGRTYRIATIFGNLTVALYKFMSRYKDRIYE